MKRVRCVYPLGAKQVEKNEVFRCPSSELADGSHRAAVRSCVDELYEGCKVKLKCSYREYFLELPVKTITCKQKRLQAEARLWPRKEETRRLSAISV